MYIIYKTTNLLNGKIYIGQHQVKNIETLDSFYLGSGTYIIRSLKKHGFCNFKRDIICKISNDDVNKVNSLEEYFIKKYNSCNREIGYNIIKGSPFIFNPMKNPEVSKKVSFKLRNGCHHDVRGSKNPNFGNVGIITGDKNPMKNKEVSKNNADLRRGKTRNEEQRIRISKAKKGRCLGIENPNFGNKWTEEQKTALSIKLKEKYKNKQNENIVC